jgi:hypothetical protein
MFLIVLKDYKRLALTIILYLASLKIKTTKSDLYFLTYITQNNKLEVYEKWVIICNRFNLEVETNQHKYIFTSIYNFENEYL